MGKDGDLARGLKKKMPQHADRLEKIAQSLDVCDRLLQESDERWKRLNSGTA